MTRIFSGGSPNSRTRSAFTVSEMVTTVSAPWTARERSQRKPALRYHGSRKCGEKTVTSLTLTMYLPGTDSGTLWPGKKKSRTFPRRERRKTDFCDQVAESHRAVPDEGRHDHRMRELFEEPLLVQGGDDRVDLPDVGVPRKRRQKVLVDASDPGAAIEHPVQVDAHSTGAPQRRWKNGTAASRIAV